MQRFPVIAQGKEPRRATLPYQSLAERARELEDELNKAPSSTLGTEHGDHVTTDGLAIGDVYDQLYRTYCGKVRFKRLTARQKECLQRAWSWCVDNEVDFRAYVAANMTLMQNSNLKFGFQPNMLNGVNAQKRYHGYMDRANRRYRNGRSEDFASRETWIGRVRTRAWLTEVEVAELYVRGNLREQDGSPDDPTWEEAIESAGNISHEWRSLTNRRGKTWVEITRLWSVERAEKERLLMVLTAAWNVAQGLQHGLPTRVGYTEFSWPAFLKLMRVVLPELPKKAVTVDVSDVDVIRWGEGRGDEC